MNNNLSEYNGVWITVISNNGEVIQYASDIGPRYSITKETTRKNKCTVYRIIALQEFANIKKFELGGFISDLNVMSQEDRSWVYGDSIVINSDLIKNTMIESELVIIENCTLENCSIGGPDGDSKIVLINSELRECNISNYGITITIKDSIISLSEICDAKGTIVHIEDSQVTKVNIGSCDVMLKRNNITLRNVIIYGINVVGDVKLDGLRINGDVAIKGVSKSIKMLEYVPINYVGNIFSLNKLESLLVKKAVDNKIIIDKITKIDKLVKDMNDMKQ